jgi:TonB family protein
MVILEIDAAGTVTAAHVETSSGSRALDDAALQKLATWRFEPARRAGIAVPGTFRQQVVFRLTDRVRG